MTRQIPILFKGEMVRAIRDGRKTVTRRVIKSPHAQEADAWAYGSERDLWESGIAGDHGAMGHGEWVRCPYGKPGDELYVRETFAIETNFDTGSHYGPPYSDGRPINWTEEAEWGKYWQQCHYRATDEAPDLCCQDPKCKTCESNDAGPHWRPSIHMPKWASRIRLTVTEVRVERVQDISEVDAIAEGVQRVPLSDGPGAWWTGNVQGGPELHARTPVAAFEKLWRSINDGREGCAWDDNPWVWCLRFERKAGAT